MNTRISRGFVIKLIVFAALALIVIYIMSNTYWTEQSIPKPLSGEAVTNPFYSAQHLVDLLGGHAEWKHVLTDMPANNAIIVLSYWNWDVISARREKLQQWVEQGGRLIVDESLITGDSSLKQWTGLEYQTVPKKNKSADDDTDEDDQPAPKVDDHGDMCESLHLIDHRPDADPDRTAYQVCNYNWKRYITSTKPVIWGVRTAYGLQAARINIGKGSITLFNATPFGNLDLLKGEHGLMFVGAAQLHRGDHVYFLKDEKGTPLLKLVWMYGSPVVVLALFLIIATLWRSGMRFGPLAAIHDTARRSLGEQISGSGKFILRFNGGRALHAATVRALHETARHHIVHYDRMSSQDRIAALATTTGVDVDTLIGAFNFQGAQSSTEWRRVIMILEQARRHLLNIKHIDKLHRRSHAS